MLVEVAERVGPPFPEILRQPYALTLFAYYRLLERDRIHALRDRLTAVNTATLNAMAFNDPKKLTLEQDAAREAARRTRQIAPEDAQANAERDARLARLIAAVDSGGLLEDR